MNAKGGCLRTGQRLETTSNRHIVTARAPLAITSVVLSAPSPSPLQLLNPEQIYHTYRKDAFRSLVRSLLELVEREVCPKGYYQLAFSGCCIPADLLASAPWLLDAFQNADLICV